ncbi:hypothetical protein [uncultured Ferrimonas sp.]|uniref:hypothetical protein n=1 Tax=uncultured Ferrimonas sp. TaxID=432640 RepID=UPI002621FA91|nr:hypothetical protein [uncultured Ferrimonas sp.]
MLRAVIRLSLLFPCYATALWGITIPQWLEQESQQLVQELNSGVGQSQNPEFIKAEYRYGEMTFYYRSLIHDPATAFGAVVEDHQEQVLRQYCNSDYYRQRLEAGLSYRHIYQGPHAPEPMQITAERCASLFY